MPFKTQSGADLRSRLPKPQESRRPPDLRGRVEVEPLETDFEVAPTHAETKLNNLETAWLSVLRARRHDWLGIQPFGMKLASNKCYYHPDFLTLNSGKLTAWEVKGPQFWDDAKVKLKVAAKEYPFIRFVLVTRDKSGWTETVVKP